MGELSSGRIASLSFSRDIIEYEIERLITLLDLLDGDADYEPDADSEPAGDDEPSLGWFDTEGGIVHGADTDLEWGAGW